MQEYRALVATDPQLDPTFEVPHNSSAEMEVDEQEEQQTALEELPASSSSAMSSRKRRRQQSDTSGEIGTSRPKRRSPLSDGVVVPRYPLRNLTAPFSTPQKPKFTRDVDILDWRKVCRKLLRELKQDKRSIFFREPVNVDEYAVS